MVHLCGEVQENPIEDAKLLHGLGHRHGFALNRDQLPVLWDEGEQDAGAEKATLTTESTACLWQWNKWKSNEEKEMLKPWYVGGGGEETHWFGRKGRCYFCQTVLISALM